MCSRPDSIGQRPVIRVSGTEAQVGEGVQAGDGVVAPERVVKLHPKRQAPCGMHKHSATLFAITGSDLLSYEALERLGMMLRDPWGR